MANPMDKQQIIDQFIRKNPGNAICYSGYRQGQSPRQEIFPSYAEIREDLFILAQNWSFIRLYDTSPHAEITLKVIRDEGLNIKVMVGANMTAEVSNPHCPWGANYNDETLIANRKTNHNNIEQLIALANQYPDIVFSVSIGNEASVDWTDHLVPTENLVAYAKRLRYAVTQPVTFCENYVPWTSKLDNLVAELDFISIHTYPVWEYRTIDDALAYTQENYFAVANHFPDKTVIITEAGWTTTSNRRGIESNNASEKLQARYYQQLMEWTKQEGILTFVFEAFDEPWKGSSDPNEPEKHWGLFYVDRTPKLVMQHLQ